MSNVDTAINAVRLAIATAEALSSAIGKAKDALDASTADLKTVLADIEKNRETMHETLAKDRKQADADFDKKFDGSGDD
jgi:septal ring factor EnvC (AmiA/AmiB activator)